jgi:hypothetical protein
MPVPRTGLTRRLGAVAWAPLGVILTAWSYLWRVTPVHRCEGQGSMADDMPAELPRGVSHDGVQMPETGSGPFFRRTYTGKVREARMGAAELIERLCADPNRVTPLALARFVKTTGEPWQTKVGDEFVIRMPGPWDGPVRVIEMTRTSFRLATLAGHLEAGQIEWRAFDRDGGLTFQVESRSRPGDRFSELLHSRLPLAKEIQLHMWTSVVEHVAKESGGRLTGGVHVETRRLDPEGGGLRPATGTRDGSGLRSGRGRV